ncbi:MAG: DsbA family protein [Deltaproteobacteria bacterium]|nr:DsbA family protein [Deltaproteobacteria bacterium]
MASRLILPVHYDFSSTICFVAHRVLERMHDQLEEMGVELRWRPLDLVALSGWRRGAEVAGPRRDNALRVASELDVAVRMPAVLLDSRRAHAVALALADGPREAAWRERVWSAVFEEGRDIGEEGEIERLAADLTIDLRAVEGAGDLARLEAETDAAREAEVTGVPTFHVGFPLGGIQDPHTMKLLFQRWVDRQRRVRSGE